MKQFIAGFLLIATTAFGQDQIGTIRPNHLSLQVKDLAVSTRFYADVLTLPTVSAPAGQAWFSLGNDQQIHLMAGRIEEISNARTGSHIALFVNSVNKAEQFLRRRNVTYTRLAGPDNEPQLFITDPDGYLFELTQSRKARTFGEIAAQGLKSVVSSIVD